jgi:hypothetical protein
MMKQVVFVPAVLVILFGSLQLLPLLAWASLQDPSLASVDYYMAVRGKLFVPPTIWATLTGMSAVVFGLAAICYVGVFADMDRTERAKAVPAFWAALALGASAMFALLVAVNYFGLQAGEATSLARWANR